MICIGIQYIPQLLTDYRTKLGDTEWYLVCLHSGRRFFHNPTAQKSYWNAPTQSVQDAYDELETDTIIKLVAKARGLRLEQFKERMEHDEHEITDDSEKPNTKQQKIVIVDADDEDDDNEVDESEDDQIEQEEEEEEIQSEASSPGQDLAWIYENNDDEDDIDNLDLLAEPETLNANTNDSYHDPFVDPRELSSNKQNNLGQYDSKSVALFEQMLDDPQYKVDPFSTWDREYPKFVDDLRYDELDKINDRKQVFDDWAGKEIKRRKKGKTNQSASDSQLSTSSAVSVPNTTFSVNTKDPSIQFLYFVFQNFKKKKHPYYIDFKRKFRSDPKFSEYPIDKLTDKEKESLFRGLAVWAKKEDKNERKAAVMTVLQNYLDAQVKKLTLESKDTAQDFMHLRKTIVERLLQKSSLPEEILRQPKFYAVNQKSLIETIDEFVHANR